MKPDKELVGCRWSRFTSRGIQLDMASDHQRVQAKCIKWLALPFFHYLTRAATCLIICMWLRTQCSRFLDDVDPVARAFREVRFVAQEWGRNWSVSHKHCFGRIQLHPTLPYTRPKTANVRSLLLVPSVASAVSKLRMCDCLNLVVTSFLFYVTYKAFYREKSFEVSLQNIFGVRSLSRIRWRLSKYYNISNRNTPSEECFDERFNRVQTKSNTFSGIFTIQSSIWHTVSGRRTSLFKRRFFFIRPLWTAPQLGNS